MHQNKTGFTLIELMIVIAIIGILTAIAVPSYQAHIRSTHKADAQAAMLEISNFLNQRYSDNFSYCNGGGAGCSIVSSSMPITAIPRGATGSDRKYLINTGGSRSNFNIIATPQGGQNNLDTCGTLTLDETGRRTHSLPSPGTGWRC